MSSGVCSMPAPDLLFATPFDSFDGTFKSPYRDVEGIGRLDWQATKALRIFYRFNDFQNSLVPAFGVPSYSFFGNKDWTHGHTLGADFNTGAFTHSIRFEYLKFTNNLTDAVAGSGAPFAGFPVATDFLASGLATGPSSDAPQFTLQSESPIQVRRQLRRWVSFLRYGMSLQPHSGRRICELLQPSRP